MYVVCRNLYAEMYKANIKLGEVAKNINTSEATVKRKLKGIYDWKYSEMIKIKDLINKKLKTNYTIDYLFQK